MLKSDIEYLNINASVNKKANIESGSSKLKRKWYTEDVKVGYVDWWKEAEIHNVKTSLLTTCILIVYLDQAVVT